MRIVHVLSGRCNGESANGIDKMVYNISRSQAALGHEVKVIGISDKRPLSVPGVCAVTIPPERFPLWPSQDLLSEVLSGGPHVVHLHFVFIPALTTLGRNLRERGVPYIVTPHGGLSKNALLRHPSRKKLYARLLERSYLDGAASIHAVCRPEVDDLQQFGVKAPIFVVPNGVDTASIPLELNHQFLVNRIPHAAGKRVFLFLGRLAVWQKGLDLLIDAINLAQDDLQSALFVLAGPNWRGEQAILEKRVREADLSELVVFPGPFFGHEKYDLLAGADVFVHTSRWDGLPTGILEAIAVGKPALVTEATNMGEALRENQAGFIAGSKAADIAEQLRYVVSMSATELEEVGNRGRRMVTTQFQWHNLAAQIGDHYRAVHPK